MKELKQLSKVIPFHFRLGNGIWKYDTVGNRKVYEKYSVLGYIDARDAMDLLDEVVWPHRRQRDHKEIRGRNYGGVAIDGVRKRDCGTESNTEQEKWEASDSFKRACVNWWIGRFLYSLPRMYVTKAEASSHKYDLTKYVRSKYAVELKRWYDSLSDGMKNEDYGDDVENIDSDILAVVS